MNETCLQVWGRLAMAVVVVLGLAACTNAAGGPGAPPPEPVPELAPEEAAAARALADLVEGALETSIRAFAAPPGAGQVGFEDVADITALFDPTVEPPDREGCAPMVDAAADGDGDGYPAAKTTLPIDCRLELPSFLFALVGSVELLDGDDTDPASGFESKLEYRLTITDDGETQSGSGEREVRVRRVADGSRYEVDYQDRTALGDSSMGIEARLTYTGTLEGTFESATLAIADGTFVLPTPAGDEVTVRTTGLEYDNGELREWF